ncbi:MULTISPECIES: peptidoglycan-binding domain-containing protein [unclassified Xanthobacter]|uniref:peptidoglycan-binding domain-containing protein n=1 Tax=unclassified Xanthobacter TaxID=2623496 RepID=UPI001F40E4FD|nr:MULTISPECIES: peptidoglycan-binding domain-containing protein [unclassified Xanthobacter]
MTLDTAAALSAAPSIGGPGDPFAPPPPRGGRRLKVLDVLVAAVVVAAGGAVAANALLMQVPPPHVLAAMPGAPAALAGSEKGKAPRGTSGPVSIPLPPVNPNGHGSTAGGGETNGTLGYLASKTSVTGMTTQLKPVSAEEAAAGAIAAPRPVSSLRPPLKVGPLSATGPMTVSTSSSGAGASGAGAPIRPPANVPASPRVASVQRALDKLGYGPLKATGVLNVETRETIRRFERDRRMPVDGEPTDALVRELSLISGIAIN